MDVFAAIKAFKITVLFRPLEGLLGAYVPTPNSAGMLVTTQRDHHVQRFTAAHELGHHVLEHRTVSLDINIGYVGRGEKTGHDHQELEADSFAAEFLLPKWLIVAHARRQGWGSTELRRPDVIYQLLAFGRKLLSDMLGSCVSKHLDSGPSKHTGRPAAQKV